ncbi:MAG: restriction endonuclease subunit S [Azonexus sp.]|nr:restriction endonuclease subunit S [Azonexus sp.]
MGLGELPEGWAWTTVAELGKVVSGGTPSTKEASYWGGDIAWISPSDLTGYTDKFIARGAKSITASGLQNSSATAMPAGSVHFSSRAPIGYTVISSRSMTTNQGFKSLVPADGVFNEYIYYYFKSAKQLAESVATGTTFKEISGSAFSKMPVPLPPTAEQHRIVAKIEELFSELDQGVASLKTAREQLKVYRQSLLKNAFEGKLTTAWRAARRDQLETAAALQQRIARERQARYQQQLADWQTAGQQGSKPKPPKPLPPLTTEELAELPELPAGWGWVRLGCVLDAVSGNTPKGIEQTSGREVPFYRVSDMNREGNELYMNSSATYLSKAEAKGLGLTIYPAGTILFPKRGGAIATNKKRRLLVPACFDLNLMGLTNLPNGIGLGYLWNWVLSLDLASISDGSNVPQINNRNVEPLAFPVCSLAEQLEIVQELESKLSEADQLDKTLATALQQADALRQSILKKAFHGQLENRPKTKNPPLPCSNASAPGNRMA